MLKRLVAVWICLSWAIAAGEGFASEGTALSQRLDRLATRGVLAKAGVGIHVVRASDGRVVYSRGGDRLLIPASNQKILTALAALHRFGPTHRFVTRIWAPELPDGDGVVDELLVQGGGDPALNSEDWWRIAADLRRDGLRGVRGDVRVDDTHFDRPGWHPSWGRISARAYHAPIGALSANYGSYFVSIRPQKNVGSAAAVYVDPPVDYLRLRNLTKTVEPRARPKLRVDRLPATRGGGAAEEIVRVEGVARQGASRHVLPRSVLDPGLYAGSLFALQLGANGIFIDGRVKRAPRAEEEAELALLLDHKGRSLAEIVGLCMKYSNNSIAEALVKNLGAYAGGASDAPSRQGGWAVGVRALRDELRALGVDLGDANLVDGSGLSIQNRVAPRTLVQALRLGRASFSLGPEFVASMPIAERDGTLEKRIAGGDGRIRAKTGLLADAGVSALSGYAEREDGETLIFSILVNGHAGGAGGAMDAVDAIARALLDTELPAAPAGGP